MNDTTVLLDALAFAADKHRAQRRKGVGASPYINHPIEVARLVAEVGGVTDVTVLVAALLHDTVEDTETSFSELASRFGPAVAGLVAEMTDDKSHSRAQRRRLQVATAAAASPGARLIKLADKTCNVRDIAHDPPAGWDAARRREYLEWAAAVVAQLRGTSAPLEAAFDAALAEAHARL